MGEWERRDLLQTVVKIGPAVIFCEDIDAVSTAEISSPAEEFEIFPMLEDGVMTVLIIRREDGDIKVPESLCSTDSKEESTTAAETFLTMATTGSEAPKKFGFATWIGNSSIREDEESIPITEPTMVSLRCFSCAVLSCKCGIVSNTDKVDKKLHFRSPWLSRRKSKM